MSKLWTNEEVQVLKECYPRFLASQISPLLGRTAKAIQWKAECLGIRKKPYAWSRTEVEILEKHYSTCSLSELAKLLPERSYNAIESRAGIIGVKKPPEVKSRLISEAKTGKRRSEELCRKLSDFRKGKPLSEETRAKISKKLKGKPPANRGRRQSIETKIKRNAAIREKLANPEVKEKMRTTARKHWAKKEFREKVISLIIQSMAKRPNKLEQRVIEILNNNFLNEWEYTGDGKVILNGFVPDFININGKKKVIEAFGTYWHSGVRIKGRQNRSAPGRIKAYWKLGYDCLVLWDKDIEDEQKVISLVRRFMEDKNAQLGTGSAAS